MTDKIIPINKWTHTGDRVLILKCVNADGTSYGGFAWPESGPVDPGHWSREPDCDSGGLFGWPWGLAFGDGKEPDFSGRWIVFAAHPEDVIDLGGKVKAIPNPEANRTPEVIYSGTHAEASQRIIDGQIAWIQQASRGAASATGERGAASATGESGAASAMGESGAASATGWSGAASATGWSGAASATGERGAASAMGKRGAASATGWKGAASATGESGAASATGERGAASATGWRGAASATGERGAASATGERGAASATGEKSVATLTGEYGTVKASETGIAATTAEDCWWQVVEGAIFLQRWADGHRLITAAEINAKTGDLIQIVRGEIVRTYTSEAAR